MSRKCTLTNKGSLNGFKVSHAHNRTRKVWQANLQSKRLFDSESGTWVKIKVSTRTLRTINKKGLAATLKDAGLNISDLRA
jgi:large subunit ribosomal protein L28